MKYRIIGADGKMYGPAGLEELRQWLSQGRLNSGTLVYVDGAPGWVPLASLPEFAAGIAPQPAAIGALAPGAPGPRGTNGFAIAGLVCGVLSWACCCCLPFNLLGVVFSIIALAQISSQPVPQEGRALAIVGLCLSILSLCFFVVAGMIQALTNPGTFNWQANF